MKIHKLAYRIASNIHKEVKDAELISIEEPEIASIQIIPESLTRNCKPYIQRIAREINGTHEKGFHSACAVMIRRLIETCMIESFEKKRLTSIIKKPNSNEYKTAEEIKNELLQNPFGNLSRTARRALSNKNILELGHKCAHDRFFTARKYDIDDIKTEVRSLIEYLIHQFI
jgi:hypothetical protein